MKKYIVFLFVLVVTTLLFAQENDRRDFPGQNWAVGGYMRVATIPFATDIDRTVGSFVPMLWYQGDRWFMRGIWGGFKILERDAYSLNAIGRMRFFDFPKEYQNRVQGTTFMWGMQLKYKPFGKLIYVDMEALSDWQWHYSGVLRLGFDIRGERYVLEPFVKAEYKGQEYNSYFYGLTIDNIKPGVETSVGVIAGYQVWKNLYLHGSAKLTLLDRAVRNSQLINRDVNAEAFIGFGFTNERQKSAPKSFKSKAFFRLAHGWATPSALAQIIRFNAKKDSANNQITTIFYGHPLSDHLFGLPIDIYFLSGLGWHWGSSTQNNSQEYVIAIKLYYSIPLPVRLRLGAAEGLSYVNEIPSVERGNLEKKDYIPSKLLNFLDFSADINLGDIFGGKTMNSIWLGYSIHHRSAIFETAQQFGRIKGGSNFQCVHMEWHY